MCMSVLPACMFVCALHTFGVQWRPEGGVGPLGVGLPTTVVHCVDAGN